METSSVAEDDLSHWQAQVPPSTMTIALQTPSNVELTSCEKRSVACNLNVDPPLAVAIGFFVFSSPLRCTSDIPCEGYRTSHSGVPSLR